MHEFFAFTISGLTTGGIYAITAGGLTLTYTTTGIFNFAHGTTGMFAAFCYWQMHYGWGWPTWLSLLVCLLVLAPLTGVLLQVVIMRRLEGTSETTKLMVTVALLLSVMAATLWIWDPNVNRTIRPFMPGTTWVVGGVNITAQDVITVVVALGVAVALWVLLTRTRSGVAMRASVDDRSLAVLNGSHPQVPGMIAWAIGTSLAAIAGILVAPKLSLSPLTLTLLIINAYAAAVMGRLKSLPWTFFGALILGLTNDYAVGYLPKWTSGYKYLSGFVSVVPVAVLFIVLLALPQSRLRGHAATRAREIAARPTWPGTAAFAAAVVFGGVVAAHSISRSDLFLSTQMWGLAIVGLSVIPLVGYAGKLSLCQLGFAGIGAVVVSHSGGHGQLISLLWAAIVCAVVGAIIALPALRLSGIYLALATAAFAVALDRWIFMFPKFSFFGHEFDLFNSGTLYFDRFHIPGVSIKSDRAFFVFGAVVFALVAVLVTAVRRSEMGRRFMAMKDSPAACATIGMNHKLTTLGAFALSAAIAGIGGGMYGAASATVSSTQFQFVSGLSVLMLMVIAGLTSPGAALFVGIVIGTPLMNNLFPHWAQLTTVLIGLNGIALGKNPNGFIPTKIRTAWDPALKLPYWVVGTVGVEIVLGCLRIAGTIDNWTYIVLAVVCVVGLAAVARYNENKTKERTGEDLLEEGLSAQPEALGMTSPFTPGDVEALDKLISMPPPPPRPVVPAGLTPAVAFQGGAVDGS